VAAVDSQGRGQTTRATSEIEEASGLAMLLHEFDAFEGLEGADENSRGGCGRLADNVQHKMSAVIKKNINVTRSEIHRTDAWRGAAEMVSGGIGWGIGFDFDDASAETTSREIVDDDFADEEAREFDGIYRKFRTL
jgi:hypothetical protein